MCDYVVLLLEILLQILLRTIALAWVAIISHDIVHCYFMVFVYEDWACENYGGRRRASIGSSENLISRRS